MDTLFVLIFCIVLIQYMLVLELSCVKSDYRTRTQNERIVKECSVRKETEFVVSWAFRSVIFHHWLGRRQRLRLTSWPRTRRPLTVFYKSIKSALSYNSLISFRNVQMRGEKKIPAPGATAKTGDINISRFAWKRKTWRRRDDNDDHVVLHTWRWFDNRLPLEQTDVCGADPKNHMKQDVAMGPNLVNGSWMLANSNMSGHIKRDLRHLEVWQKGSSSDNYTRERRINICVSREEEEHEFLDRPPKLLETMHCKR
jgi:hypothetical protein